MVIPTRLLQETQPEPSSIDRAFSEHPGDMRAWRNIVGKAIEPALANGTCDRPLDGEYDMNVMYNYGYGHDGMVAVVIVF